MTQKRKLKPNSLTDILFDKILFIKQYTFETPLQLYLVMVRLHELSDEKHDRPSQKPRFIVESKQFPDYYAFDICAKDHRHQYTMAHATGIAYSTDKNGTIIEGEVRLGGVYFALLLLSVLWIFFVFQLFNLGPPVWLLGILMIVPTVTLAHLFYKRQLLVNRIQSAMTPRMTDFPIIESEPRKGIHEVYAELEREFGYRFDGSPEQVDYDQQ